jgi:hypothetical protein
VTRQETFEKVVKAVIAQGRPSATIRADNSVRCLYRGPDGCKCAAGHLIPDEDFKPAMEGCSATNSIHIKEVLKRDGHNADLVFELQNAHDSAARMSRTYAGFDNANFVEKFKEQAKDVARKHRLHTEALA